MFVISEDIDLTGKKFGNLLVVSKGDPFLEKSKNTKSGYTKRRTWNCLCDCGNYKENVLEHSLKAGYVRSCGCLKKIQYGKPFPKKYNTYDLTSFDYGIGYDNKGEEFYFDLEDYDIIKDYCWIVKNNFYVEG